MTALKKIPVMGENGKVAITDKDKATMLAQTFAKAHSIENLDDTFLTRRQQRKSKILIVFWMTSLVILN